MTGRGRRKTDTKGIYKFLFVLLFSLSFFYASAQNTSNKGTEFWLGFGNHAAGYAGNEQKLVLYITSDVSTKGKVEVKAIGFSLNFSVNANSITQVEVPAQAYLKGEGKYTTGIHVSAELPVVVYSHIFDMYVSGATLVLPVSSLGKDYYSLNYKQVANTINGFSYFFVLATEDNTKVEITPSAKTSSGWPAGETRTIVLNQGEIYQVLGEGNVKQDAGQAGGTTIYNYTGVDLTGSRIRSVSTSLNEPCKRIAVFSGSGKIGIGCSAAGVGSSDNLYQQVYPTSSWGKKFYTVPLASRDYDIFRIVKSKQGGTVKLNGSIIPASSFVNSFYFEFNSQTPNIVEADIPIQVVQYSVSMTRMMNCGYSSERTGDPEMIFLNPVEQNIDKITVYSAEKSKILNNYINVVIPKVAADSFLLDGQRRMSLFKPFAGDNSYSYAQIPVEKGVHTLEAPRGFNAVAYGFGDAESYGYSAGANVTGLNLSILNSLSKKEVKSGCVAEPLEFRISLATEVSKLTWDFKNGKPPVELTYAKADSQFTEQGKTYFLYRFNQPVLFPAEQNYQIEVTAVKKSADDCGLVERFPFEFSVYPPPVAEFEADMVCNGTKTKFNDKSYGMGRVIKTWFWEFGDGKTSSLKNPEHEYSDPGLYHVALTISTESGCSPVTVIHDVRVFKRPKAEFEIDGTCFSKASIFTDRSLSADGPIKKWIWDFGDGFSQSFLTDAPFNYVYKSYGKFKVRLIVETENGCRDTINKDLTINPRPKAAFIPPAVCLTDPFAEFINTSKMEDSPFSVLSYKWDFGDAYASPANPNVSTAKNPRHRYSFTGEYTATLVVSSDHACTDTVRISFTVNGTNPSAVFDVENKDYLCCSDPVQFRDKSTVANGKITRIIWYYDFDNFPQLADTTDNPGYGAVYSHKYPDFYLQASKTFRVKLKAYSGGLCVDEISQLISINGTTEVEFSPPAGICSNSEPIQLRAVEKHGVQGAGVFEGTGVSKSGLFNPRLAGPGKHDITYRFKISNGCEVSTVSKVSVFANPAADGGQAKMILFGGQVKLDPVIEGNIISYKWSPSTGLSSDDIPGPIASPLQSTTYTLQVVTKNGCSAVTQIKVNVLLKPEIPNAFTPNNDGRNELWEVKYLETLPACRVMVYSRYGQLVFSSIGYRQPWNGVFQGASVPDGTYYYVINPGNGQKSFSGSVTIIR